MKNIAQFVSQGQLDAFTSLDPNIQLNEIVPHMITAQEEYLQSVLGSNFYNVLTNQIVQYVNTGSTASFSPYYQSFINDFCAPMVYQATVYKALPWIAYKVKAKGVIQGVTEPTQYKQTTMDELKLLRDQAFQSMDFYKERMRRELSLFTYRYPDYLNWSIQQNMWPVRSVTYGKGVAIPKSRSKVFNQNYGLPLELQGYDYINSISGVDLYYELHAPIPLH